eukprot:TRINITY_DN3492_c0_g1_i3.p1 TRINITY_DN3492_c0_g1~~TRINITY_DN3492_c0_g1_i3.p1  ORF type:complete len:307 (-),score=88.72 TRINITY_DN3492_c0_g1_i3:38-958(-)
MDIDDGSLQVRLIRACDDGDPAVVSELLRQAGATALQSVDDEGRTPLLAACSSGSVELVKLLLEAGADAEVMDRDGQGIALKAAESGSRELLAALLSQGLVDLTECAEDGTTALLSAAGGCREQSADMVAFLLDGPPGALAAPSLEERDERGADALLVAAEAGSVDVVKELLRRGTSASSVDSHGCCILHYAAAGGSEAMLQFCVRNLKVPSQIQDADGDTPLILAAYEGNADAVLWLLKNGSSLEERNHSGISAAMAAAAADQPEVLKVIGKFEGKSSGNVWLQEVEQNPNLVLSLLEQNASEAS